MARIRIPAASLFRPLDEVATVILEGIVTTVAVDGQVNIAPMGPRVPENMQRLLLRPFPSSQTYRNLKCCGEGVFHVTDDVLLIAQAAVGMVEPVPPTFAASRVAGHVLADACRYYEFRVVEMDESQERVRIEAEVVHAGRLRDFLGFNRAKHAVVEAAILATRIHLLPRAEIEVEFRRLSVLVEKTGGGQEHEAFAFLRDYVERSAPREHPA
jgi:hypothetical protein